MIERGEILAVGFTKRLIRRRCVVRTEGCEQVTRKSASSEAQRRLTIVHDVGGPIVTGVLGGD